MIIPLNIKKENTYYKIFEAVKIAFAKLNSNTQNTKGRPRKYSDEQIVCCMLYGVKNSIFSLRELEYRIKQDPIFKSIIQINDVPGYFKGYKLHCIATVTDIIIPLVFDLTTANVYDNQLSDLLYEAKIYNPFLLLADAAYDSSEWFNIASNLKVNLLTDINMRKAKSIESFTTERYC